MLIKVYDTEGKEHMKESVDARECVAAMGWTFTEPKPAVEVKVDPEKEPEAEPKPAVNLNKNNFNPKR